MTFGIVKTTWKTFAGWVLQIYAIIRLLLIIYLIFFIPVPDSPTPEAALTPYEELIGNMSSYAGLLWVGVFCLGRWLVKKDKQIQD